MSVFIPPAIWFLAIALIAIASLTANLVFLRSFHKPSSKTIDKTPTPAGSFHMVTDRMFSFLWELHLSMTTAHAKALKRPGRTCIPGGTAGHWHKTVQAKLVWLRVLSGSLDHLETLDTIGMHDIKPIRDLRLGIEALCNDFSRDPTTVSRRDCAVVIRRGKEIVAACKSWEKLNAALNLFLVGEHARTLIRAAADRHVTPEIEAILKDHAEGIAILREDMKENGNWTLNMDFDGADWLLEQVTTT